MPSLLREPSRAHDDADEGSKCADGGKGTGPCLVIVNVSDAQALDGNHVVLFLIPSPPTLFGFVFLEIVTSGSDTSPSRRIDEGRG